MRGALHAVTALVGDLSTGRTPTVAWEELEPGGLKLLPVDVADPRESSPGRFTDSCLQRSPRHVVVVHMDLPPGAIPRVRYVEYS